MSSKLTFVFKCILLTSAFLYHCIIVSVNYFNYPFNVKVAPFIPVTQPVPSLSLCFPLSSLLARDASHYFFASDLVTYTNRTIGEIMNRTPRANEILETCSYRNFTDDSMVKLVGPSRCTDYFSVRRFRLNGNVCYRLSPPRYEYTLYSVSFVGNNRRILYKMSLNEPVNRGHIICPVIQMSDYTSDDRIFDQEMLPSIDNNESFILTYHLYNITRLPPPYATRCFNQSRRKCYTDCMSRGYAIHGLANINSESDNEDVSLLLPDYESKYNGLSRSAIRNRFNPKCKELCNSDGLCQQYLTVTDIGSPLVSRHKLSLTVETLSNPPTRMKLIAAMSLIDYLTILASFAGIFYGFSVLKVLRKKKVRQGSHLRRHLTHLSKMTMLAHTINTQIMQHSISTIDRVKMNSSLGRNYARNIHICFKICVLALFAYQVYNVNEEYFKYITLTKLNFDSDPVQRAPNLSVCFSQSNIFSTAKFVLTNRSNYDPIFSRRYEQNYTLREMFDRAWPISKILSGCRMRVKGDKDWAFQYFDFNRCLEHLRITVFYFRFHICYQFNLKKEELYTQSQHKFLTHDAGLHFSIVFTDFVAKQSSRLVFLFFSKLPLISFDFGIFHRREEGNWVYILSTFRTFLKKLPPPYDTRCTFVEGKPECYRNCMINRTARELNQLSFSELYVEPSDKRVLSYVDLKDNRKSEAWFAIEKLCAELCTRGPCEDDIVKTGVTTGYRSNFTFEYAIDSHKYPDVHTETIEKMSLFDFSFQMQCCASFWLGVTVMGLMSLKRFKVKSGGSNRNLLQSSVRNLMKKAVITIMVTERTLSHYWRVIFNQSRWRTPLLYSYLVLSVKHRVNQGSFNIILTIFCMIGCCLQSYHSISQYMQYPTTMYTMSETESNSSYYDLSVCMRLSSKYFVSDRGVNISYDKLTVGHILNITVTKNLLSGCGYRGLRPLSRSSNLTNRLYFYEYNDPQFCNSLFDIESFVLQGMLCHKFREKYPLNKTDYEDLHALNWPKMQYSVVLNRSELGDDITLILFKYNWYPFHSGMFSPTIKHLGDNIWFIVSYLKYMTESLPSPYSVGDFTDVLHVWCVDDCINEVINPLGFNTPGLMMKDFEGKRTDVRVVNTNVKKNKSFSSIYSRTERDCYSKCLRRTSTNFKEKHSLMVTTVNEPAISSNSNLKGAIEFFIRTTDYPVIMLKFKPQFNLFELFITLGSILGIWFGFSAVDCDPSRLLNNTSPTAIVNAKTRLEKNIGEMIAIKRRLHRWQ